MYKSGSDLGTLIYNTANIMHLYRKNTIQARSFWNFAYAKAKTQARLRICAVSPEPSLFAYTI